MFKESNKEIKMVHKKLMAARIMLQNAPLKKSGHNKFAGYSYFELGDFIPTINQIKFSSNFNTFRFLNINTLGELIVL